MGQVQGGNKGQRLETVAIRAVARRGHAMRDAGGRAVGGKGGGDLRQGRCAPPRRLLHGHAANDAVVGPDLGAVGPRERHEGGALENAEGSDGGERNKHATHNTGQRETHGAEGPELKLLDNVLGQGPHRFPTRAPNLVIRQSARTRSSPRMRWRCQSPC
eukprot:1576554-Pyramimonas_sp.AAC.1